MNLFGVGLPEFGLIAILALVLIGPQRFPEIARQAGRWYRMARAFTDAVMADVRSAVDEIEEEIGTEELKKEFQDKDGNVRPIRELQDLRRDIETAKQDTTEIGKDLKQSMDRSDREAADATAGAAGRPASTPSPADAGDTGTGDTAVDDTEAGASDEVTPAAAEREAGR